MGRLHGQGLAIFEGTGGFGRRRRGPGAFTLMVTIVVLLALAGAATWVVYRRLNPNNRVPLLVLGITVTDAETGIPDDAMIAMPDGTKYLTLAGAVVTGPEGKTVSTNEDGTAKLSFTPPAQLTVTAPGYQDALFQVDAVPPDGPLGLQLDPLVLKGRVRDPQGSAVAGAAVQVGERAATTDHERFGSQRGFSIGPPHERRRRLVGRRHVRASARSVLRGNQPSGSRASGPSSPITLRSARTDLHPYG